MRGDHFQCRPPLVTKGSVFPLVDCVIEAFKYFHLARKWWGETREDILDSATRGSISRDGCWVTMDVPVDPKNRQLPSSEEIQLPSPHDCLSHTYPTLSLKADQILSRTIKTSQLLTLEGKTTKKWEEHRSFLIVQSMVKWFFCSKASRAGGHRRGFLGQLYQMP